MAGGDKGEKYKVEFFFRHTKYSAAKKEEN